jgi:glycerophosphoryl diester phosphodiesterase
MRLAIISHRGLCRAAPRARRTGENTLDAFQAGIDALDAMGFPPAIEFDVRRSADGALVVCHDATLYRSTGARGRVESHTAAELRAFGVARVEELFERFPGAEFHLEIKQRGIAQGAGELIAAYGVADRVIVSSFLWKELPALREKTRIALTTAFPTRRTIGAAVNAGAWAIHPDYRRATARLVEAAHNAGLKVNAWTVNTPRAYARMERMGVDAVFSDNPILLA